MSLHLQSHQFNTRHMNEKLSVSETKGDSSNHFSDRKSMSVPARRQSAEGRENPSFQDVILESNKFKIPSSFLVPVSPPTVPDSPPIATLTSTFASANQSECEKESPSRSKGSSGVFCRICHDGDLDGDKLISPCSCSGSVGLIHKACIEKWLSTVNQDTCEICKQKFLVSRHTKPFTSWLMTPAVGDDQRNLLGDTICFLLLTPLTTISAYLCASGAVFYMQQIKKSEAVGLMCLATLLVIIYTIWLLLTIRYHCQVWFKWRVNNQDIRLLDVTTNQPKSLKHKKEKQKANASYTKAEHAVEVDRKEEVTVDVSGLPETVENEEPLVSSKAEKSVSFIDRSVPTEEAPQEPTDEQIPEGQVPIYISPVNRLLPPFSASPLFSTPLSPVVIPTDPGSEYASVVVSSTPESDIYATSEQLGVGATSNYLCPYLPDLKNHFMTIGNNSGGEKEKKSRGTFSPRKATPFKTRTTDYERL